MANTIDILLRTKADNAGIASTQASLKNLSTSIQRSGGMVSQMAGALGSATGAAGAFGKALSAIGALLTGGVWGAAIALVSMALSKLTDLWQSFKATAEDARLAAQGMSKEFMTLEYQHSQYQKRLAKYAKESADRKAAEQKAQADALARSKALAAAEKEYYNVSKKVAEEKIRAGEATANEAEKLKIQIRLMALNAKYAVDAAKRKVGETEEGSAENFNAQKELEAALLAQKRMKEEAKAMVSKYRDRKFDEAEAARMREMEEERAFLKREESADRVKRLQESADRVKKANAEAILKIEEKIASAKAEAARLEENAARARGKSFGEWQKEERERAREGRNDRSAYRASQVDREIARIMAINPRARSAYDQKKLASLMEWRADQNPANNPAAKEAERLETEKRRIMESQEKYLADIAAAVQNAGL